MGLFLAKSRQLNRHVAVTVKKTDSPTQLGKTSLILFQGRLVFAFIEMETGLQK